MDYQETGSALVHGPIRRNFGLRHALFSDAHDRGGTWTCLLGGGARATLSVDVLDENVARVRIVAGERRPEPPRGDDAAAVAGSFLLPDIFARREFPITAEMREGGWTFATPRLRVEVGANPWRLAFRDAARTLLTEQIADDSDLRGNELAPPPGFAVEGDATAPLRRVIAAFETLRLDPEDRFYGLGERFERLERTGRSIAMWPQNAYGTRSARSHKCIPLLWTTRGYGVLVDTPRRAIFHVGAKSNRTWTIEVPGDEIDYYFLSGTPADVLDAYARLTGRPGIPPVWAFGLWVSTSYQPATADSVRTKTRRYRDSDIPADVMTLDCTWQREMRYCDLQWDRAAFPDPGGLIDTLHRDHFKVCLWENPYVSVLSDAFAEGRDKGYFLRQPDGAVYTARLWAEGRMGYCAIVDFTNPDAAAWWRAKHGPLLDVGADAFKTDFGEEIPADAVFHNGRTGAEMRNFYAQLFQRVAFDAVRERHGRGLIWGRAGFAGMQRFPAHWSGDPQCTYEDMAATIRAGLSAGMSGIPMWSHDIGGFWGTPTPDLYVRWAQFGLLSPLSRCHGLTHRDPWEFGDDAVAVFRRYARFRYRLIPYLYSAALDAADTGLPVMRAMALVHPHDPAAAAAELQYYLGDSLLVAPVTRADGRVAITLPRGRWLDFQSGERVDGGTVIHRVCSLDEIPLFVPENRILPLGPVRSWLEAQSVEPTGADPVSVEVFTRDGASFRQRGDDFARVIEARRAGDTLVLETSDAGIVEARFHGVTPPGRVTADGALVSREEEDAAYRAAPTAWRSDGAAVVVKARARVLRLEDAAAL